MEGKLFINYTTCFTLNTVIINLPPTHTHMRTRTRPGNKIVRWCPRRRPLPEPRRALMALWCRTPLVAQRFNIRWILGICESYLRPLMGLWQVGGAGGRGVRVSEGGGQVLSG